MERAGISPTGRDIAIGFEAARLNLRLALELHKPEESVQDARWLLGAHLIAAGETGAALEQFQRCSPETRPLFAGYVLLARALLHQAGAEQEFDELLAAMRAHGGDDGRSSRASSRRRGACSAADESRRYRRGDGAERDEGPRMRARRARLIRNGVLGLSATGVRGSLSVPAVRAPD